MADLQELFARLKAQSSDSASPQPAPAQPSIWNEPQQQAYQQPSVSSPLFSPPVQTPNPVHPSNIISPAQPSSNVGTPTPDQARTNNLLNLLKFNNQSSQANTQAGPMANLQNVGAGRSGSFNAVPGGAGPALRPLSAQDLVSSLQRKPSASSALPSPLTAGGADKPAPPKPSNQQDFLLNLLKRPNAAKPVQSIEQPDTPLQSTEQPDVSVDKLTQSFAEASFQPAAPGTDRESTPARQFGTAASRETTPFEAPQPTKASIFTYVNPFDQLHSSSPLNRTPQPEAQGAPKKIEILKHNRDASGLNGDGAAPAAKSRKVDESSAPSKVSEPESKNQSVSEALEGVGEKVDKQVEQALAKAGTTEKSTASAAPASGDNAAVAEPAIKKEPADRDDVESSWESAEDTANEKDGEFKVKVYNFPMKPFVTITIKPLDAMPIRQDNFMVIAQLKKEFDQMDRTLVTASQTHIVYAQTGTKRDNCGFRIIRQDTGDHKQVFRSSGERVFSVQICNSTEAGHDVESVLGTGVNGSVFWTSLAKSRPEFFADDDVEAQGFFMPAIATPEENTSNSPVKTRAKCSTRHPEYFAMQRSKTIHIIAPDTVKDRAYCDARTRKVDSAKYLAEHGLRINTGKAGKDFAFSEDDSTIVSLDKSGVVKFWDIRDLVSRASDSTEGPHEPVELKEPLWSLSSTGKDGNDKPSVSSVMLLDKERPHTKGVALRYVLVGYKQNHILQLWDLGLSKAVQEIRLPHEQDSDGICSLSYHPKSGIIAVGHPTRNTIYFIHLSAPKYNIPFMDQARYITMLARNDPHLPKPESTAIMSGLRAFAFDKVGQLRSVDMLKTPVENAGERGTKEETLFELYAMHSRGVVGMAIKRADLGWDEQSKMVEPVDAVKEGVVEVADLNLVLVKGDVGGAVSEVGSSLGESAGSKKGARKQQPELAKAAPKGPEATPTRRVEASPAPATNGAQRTDAAAEQASMQIPEAPTPSQTAAVNPPLITADSYAMAAQRVKSPPERERAVQEATDAAKKAAASPPKATSAIAAAPVSPDTHASLSKQFDSLYQRLDADKRVSEAAGSARQDAMLRLVSSTLTENVEQSLHRIIGASIDQQVVPTLTDATTKIINSKLNDLLPREISTTVQREIKAALPAALQTALQHQNVQKAISDATATAVAQKVQQQVSGLLAQGLPNMATQAAQKMVADLETKMKKGMREAETTRMQDNVKINQLTGMVTTLSQTIQRMEERFAGFQEEMVRLMTGSGPTADSGEERSKVGEKGVEKEVVQESEEKVREREEVEVITQMLVDGEYQEATIQWLQSPNQALLFDNLFVRVNPQYLQNVTPLVNLSVSAAITASLDTHTEQRLDWLAAVLSQLDMKDPDIVDVAPKILDVLGQRLSVAYMATAEMGEGKEVVLRKISALFKQVGEVRRVVG